MFCDRYKEYILILSEGIQIQMDDTILKYLQSTAGKEEKEQLLHWLQESESNKKAFIDLRDIWLTSGNTPTQDGEYIQKAFLQFKENIDRAEKKSRTARYIRPLLRIAASIAIILGCSVEGYLIGRQHPDIIYMEQDPIVMNQAIMGTGSKGSVTLPDGSIAWLNTNSKLTYPEKFSDKYRKVKLEGEGYFEVKKNKQAPFFVETNQMTANVLGTNFDVKDYADKMNSEATLLTGQIEIHLPDNPKSIPLKPNQRISLNKQTGVHEIKHVNASEYILWINEKLVCNNEKLSVVLHKIKLWYGMGLICQQGTPVDQRLSLTIRKESPDEIFKLLEMIVPIRYSIKDDVIYVRPK